MKGTKMEEQKHKERHKLLHKMLDELFADYINHHPEQTGFTKIPIGDLLQWSYKQTQKPTPEPRNEEI